MLGEQGGGSVCHGWQVVALSAARVEEREKLMMRLCLAFLPVDASGAARAKMRRCGWSNSGHNYNDCTSYLREKA